MLEKLQKQHLHLFHGVVLDVGGRDRGIEKPKSKVKKWIFLDIEESFKPDIVADVTNMKGKIRSGSIDVILANELFEHVENPEKGICECARVLKKGGTFIISVPFLYPIHGDPYDFQRWTLQKWRLVLERAGFDLEELKVMGGYFTALGSLLRDLVKSLPFGLRHLCYLSFPLIDLLTLIDKTPWAMDHSRLASYHGGYYIVARKKVRK